ncbi:MAG: hypothetical protein IJG15_05705 [Lachnospiraceae bacterium]|nr:hypothetical protein [Lachnospiraceae bacterium]
MEDRTRQPLETGPDTMTSAGAELAEQNKEGSGAQGHKAGKPKAGTVRFLIALCVVCAAGFLYWWNQPVQRLDRALKKADNLMQEESYEAAAASYAEAAEIDPENTRAQEGLLDALTGQADALAQETDIPARAQACGLYSQILVRCRTMKDGAYEDPDQLERIRTQTQEKLDQLRVQMAAEYDHVETVTQTDDRSGKAVLPDGTDKPYTWYYDLVQISDEYYPYRDALNETLARGRDAFFADTEGTLSGAAAGGPAEGEYRDYVGVSGIYSGQGLLNIRMAEVRILGRTRVNIYRGRTYRLSDAAPVTLADLVDRTDSGLRRLVKRRVRDWLSTEGYTDISRSAIEEYAEETDPEDFKFCLRDDGTICLVIDQEAPFFATGTEILEIPLE